MVTFGNSFAFFFLIISTTWPQQPSPNENLFQWKEQREVKTCCCWGVNQVWAWCLTWQQHSFLPHHGVEALWESLNEVVSIGHPGCSVDVLSAHSIWVHGTVWYVISDRARKEHRLLGDAEGRRDNVSQRFLMFLFACVLPHLVKNSDLSPGSQFQCDSWASKDLNPWCRDRL